MDNPQSGNDAKARGDSLYRLIERLYPICRSITGDGVRDTLAIVAESIPLEIFEVPSGTQVFDWEVPREWNIRDAYIKDADGRRVVDFRESNLHVVNYSVPVAKQTMPLADLRDHLYSIPEQPDWIPYRTSYYAESWGFCLTHRQLEQLTDDEYEVCIDSSLEPGNLTYGECLVKGETSEEVIIYTHVCHPSLCNDNLSGIAVATQLAASLQQHKTKYSYRFIFAPGTIGSITWLSRNEDRLSAIRHGLIVALVGDAGPLNYKRSRDGDAMIDRAATRILKERADDAVIQEFSPYGYDERQFGSPGINLPVGRLTRSPNGAYPEYHTSADNLELIDPANLSEAFEVCMDIIDVLERDGVYRNTSPMCEPQLGKRGLYSKTGGKKQIGDREYALLWVLNQADGRHSLLEIARKSGIRFADIAGAAEELLEAGLLEPQQKSRA